MSFVSLSIEQGEEVVKLARSTLDSFVGKNGSQVRSWSTGYLSELRGVFVTLNKAGPAEERLRGCIGFPYPVKRLGEAVQEATMAAAAEDPRFPPVTSQELASISVEVSVLTPPKVIGSKSRGELSKSIKVGRDGLVVRRQNYSGLLLPQVATEFNLDVVDFLSQTCIKAGLSPDAWLDEGTEVSSFQAEIFAEDSPRGVIRRVEV